MLTQTSTAKLEFIQLDILQSHPDNPRLELRSDVIEQLTAQMSESGFGSEHAVLVRPVVEGFQIISGHHRVEAARKVGLSEVPCWVREMDDDEAFMQLVLSNAQGELSPLEIGMHALKAVPLAKGGRGQTGGLSEYAQKIGRGDDSVRQWRSAADVFTETSDMCREFSDKTRHLHEISKAPRETWPALVAALAKRGWTVAETGAEVKTVQQFDIPEAHAEWLPLEAVVNRYLSGGKPKPAAVQQLITTVDGVLAAIATNEWATDEDREQFLSWLHFNSGSDAWDRKAINDRHVELIRAWAQRQADAVVAEDEPEQLLPDGIEIRLGDFRHLFAADPDQCDDGEHWPMAGQVDAIITDPPYPAEFLELFGNLDGDVNPIDGLAEVSARILKPGGICAVMIGQSYLPEIVARMSKALDYRWTLAYLTPGGQAVQVWDRKVNTFWKPILLFTNGKPENADWLGDVTTSAVNDNDKNHHYWGQSESGMADLIERLSKPGDLVCDPFLGGGTTAVVCHQLGRRFIGCDVDQQCLDTTIERFTA
jgi:site-specific DNA-methyltransferase (adenine-specific)